MQKLDLEVQPREMKSTEGKKNPNQLRREGWIPGVLYGHGDPTPITVDAKTFNQAIHTKAGLNALFTVKVGSQSNLSIIKEVQRDIISRKPVHVDFQRIDVKEKLEVTVPVHPIGEAPGVKNQQGILEQIQRDIRIKCLPDDIPPSLDVDISHLELHQTIKVKDLTLPKGVEVVTALDYIVFNIVMPKIEEEVKPAVGTEGVPGTPEVITKGKKDEEGAAAATTGAAAPAAAAGGDKDKKKAK